MRRTAVLAAAAVLLAACAASSSWSRPSPGRLRGKIEGVRNPSAAARVQVYGLDEDGLVTRAPHESVPVDADGRFATRPLSPGRYRIIYRDPAAPPSVTTVRVPVESPVVMHRVTGSDLVELRALTAASQPLDCRLTSEARVEGVADVREFRCSPEREAVVRGLRPGRWRIDVLGVGATTEIDLPAGSSAREVTIDPPPVGEGGSVIGQVRRLDGRGAGSFFVTARPLDPSRAAAERWGRFAETDGEGAYRIVGIPPGEALVRVECREVLARILPAARRVTIPPSGALVQGFLVEP